MLNWQLDNYIKISNKIEIFLYRQGSVSAHVQRGFQRWRTRLLQKEFRFEAAQENLDRVSTQIVENSKETSPTKSWWKRMKPPEGMDFEWRVLSNKTPFIEF